MLARRDVAQRIGDKCSPRYNRKGVKYIAVNMEGVIGTVVNCKTGCPFYPCYPKPYLVVPITSDLKVAIKMFFPKINYGDDNYGDKWDKRRPALKKFIREWVRKK